MAPAQNKQLEHVISEVLKTGDVQTLDVFLQREIYEETPMKCSQQFLTKLDKLINRGLVQKDPRLASLGLASLYKCGKNLILPGGRQGLSGLIEQGLIKKMVEWFGKCRQLWIQCGPQWDENLINLSEDFLNVLMVVHEACKEGTYGISESFLYPVGQLAVDPKSYILIKKEAIRKFNLFLDKIPVDLKKDRQILSSQEASDIMVKLAGQILEAGDYDFQSSLMEALCRMATHDERKALAHKWFSMGHVASAFGQIRDSEFETACRKFLNMVNGMQGDKRRVYSYPCLEVYLDSFELLMPLDEKLEEFWIDFNLGSHSISFYFSLADEEVQDSHWETMCINEHEVQSYNVKEESKRQVLQIKLSEVVIVGAVEGSSLIIHFSSSLDILQAARNVYGHNKNKGSTVVKATVKTLMEENSTQVVPESQVSLGESEKNTAPYVLPAPAAPAQMVTPARMKFSESTTFISSGGGGSVRHSFSLASNTPASGIGAEKPSLKVNTASKQAIKNKADKHKKNIPLAEAVNMALAEQVDEQSQEDNFVPDTQPKTGRNMSSNWHKLSVSEMLTMPTQKMSSLPRSETCSTLAGPQERSSSSRWSVSASSLFCQKQLHIQLTERLQQVLNGRNQDSAPTPEMADIRRDSNDTSTEDQCVSSLCTSKDQRAQSNGCVKGKTKVQTSLAIGVIPIKPSVKTSTTKNQKEKMPSEAEVENKNYPSSKEKRDTEVAGSMVKLISSHYKVDGQANKKDTAENISQNWIPPLVNRPIFNMSWLPTGKRETSRNLIKSHSKTKPSSVRKDVFAFSTNTPPSNGKANRNTSAIQSSDIHSSVLSTTKKEHPVGKVQKKRYVKKHLFSDTDTDNAMTEVSWLRESARRSKPKVTKYSRQAPIKSRAVPQHGSFESPDLLPSFPKAVMDNNKPTKKNSHMKKALGQPKETVKPAAAPRRPHAAGRRPKRAAATSAKSYKEPDTDDSQSEEPEDPPATKYSSTDHLKKTEEVHEAQNKKKTYSTQAMKKSMKPGSESLLEKPTTSKQGKHEKTCSVVPDVKIGKNTSELCTESYRRKHGNLSDFKKPSVLKRPENVLQETSKLNKKNAQEQKSSLRDSWAACQTSFCPSPPFIEKMRSADRSAPTLDLTYSPLLTPRGSLLPASPKPPCQDTPSPILLLPKPCSTVSSKEMCKSSFYSAEKNRGSSKTRSIQSVHSIASLGGQTTAPNPPAELSAAKISPIQQRLSSATYSPLSTRPVMTSTLLELDKPPLLSPAQSPFLNDTISFGHHCSLSKVSSVSQASTNSSVLTSKVKDSPTDALAISLKTEKTPLSDQDSKLAQSLVSGPSRKRHISLSSNSEDEEKEERKRSEMSGKRSPHMKPRKLFKSFEVSAVDESSQVKSSSCHWEAEVMDGDMDMDEDLDLPEIAVNPSNLCQQLNSELQKKFQKHYSLVELYNKQSLKTIQQHVSSVNTQITKSRAQRLEQVQKVLLDEITKLEQDDTVLKSMEEDLTVCRKKQMMGFHSYKKQEVRRNEILKRALQSSTCHSLEYEDRIFTSEMCMIRKDMKSVQDKLLSEMLEGELQSVKRGLHTLFFP
ncbi:synaptonemal complex protein 2 isoform X3 [Archocentrus centrarchus]|uniref:synaptonemal complex protein 2 isoform X3 n=1 Tax=Archocentrus centrarchus TaxID=63155 RepID=UPI0011E9D233|nr:synaptonemal complex protein 2 isoform X3 [Archocentrus centrarchus]